MRTPAILLFILLSQVVAVRAHATSMSATFACGVKATAEQLKNRRAELDEIAKDAPPANPKTGTAPPDADVGTPPPMPKSEPPVPKVDKIPQGLDKPVDNNIFSVDPFSPSYKDEHLMDSLMLKIPEGSYMTPTKTRLAQVGILFKDLIDLAKFLGRGSTQLVYAGANQAFKIFRSKNIPSSKYPGLVRRQIAVSKFLKEKNLNVVDFWLSENPDIARLQVKMGITETTNLKKLGYVDWDDLEKMYANQQKHFSALVDSMDNFMTPYAQWLMKFYGYFQRLPGGNLTAGNKFHDIKVRNFMYREVIDPPKEMLPKLVSFKDDTGKMKYFEPILSDF